MKFTAGNHPVRAHGIDLFAKAREEYTVYSLWAELGLQGDPKPSCKSPFRDERTPSFSIYDQGRKWADHGTGEGGDVIEFLKHALGTDCRGVRDWLIDRSGQVQAPEPKPSPKPQEKRIEWPCSIQEPTPYTLKEFAELRGYTFPAAHVMAECGALRFTEVKGHRAFIVSDERMRIAEIRRMDRQPWPNGSKAYPLKGVDKSLLLGSPIIEAATQRIMLVEGVTDYLAALDLYSRYRRKHGGRVCWVPVALLGANCRKLHAEDAKRISGRYVRIVPDADPPGDQMAEHWKALLRSKGCTVDVVNLPPKTDLSDHLHAIDPKNLFL